MKRKLDCWKELQFNMGSEDNRMMEEALNDLRQQNDSLNNQNKNIKAFLEHLNKEISNFLREPLNKT